MLTDRWMDGWAWGFLSGIALSFAVVAGAVCGG